MKNRSWLIVPGSSEERLAAAMAAGADVVVVDLEEGVSPLHKPRARRIAAQWLEAHRRSVLERRFARWVRINPPHEGMLEDDLDAVMRSAPDGVIVPKVAGPEAIRLVAAEIYECEQRYQIPLNFTAIVPVLGETPAAALGIAAFMDLNHQRLAGFSWNPAALARHIGAARPDGLLRESADAMRFVRAQTLLVAHAAGVAAIDAPLAGTGDGEAVARAAASSRAEGFTGTLVLHPEHIPAINRAFVPTRDEVEAARAIVTAFGAEPSAGSLMVEGSMVNHAQVPGARKIVEESAGSADLRRGPMLRPA